MNCNKCVWIRVYEPWGTPTGLLVCDTKNCEEVIMKQPELGWTTPVKVERVIDGDTIEVSITKKFMVRLQDDDNYFNTPEIRNASDEEKKLGERYKQYLFGLLFNSFDPDDGDILCRAKDNVVIHIGADETGKIAHSFSFSRVKGHIFVDGKDVAELMNKNKEKIESGDYE